ncbi:MAG: ribbon-helix-helix domain-containing protein [Synergistaceae bacterium]|jgi:hypothetical protein|nr:ribbon-helix-helix domain-containing protein [Synergistaceae bacterium]
MNTIRWNVAVSSETDQSLRIFLASRGGRKGDLSRVIEEAVRSYIFDQTAAQIKSANANTDEEGINSAISEALSWAQNN